MLLHPVRDGRVFAYQSWVHPRYRGGLVLFPLTSPSGTGTISQNLVWSQITARNHSRRAGCYNVKGEDYHAWA